MIFEHLFILSIILFLNFLLYLLMSVLITPHLVYITFALWPPVEVLAVVESDILMQIIRFALAV